MSVRDDMRAHYAEVDAMAPKWEYGGTFLQAWRGAALLAGISNEGGPIPRVNRMGADTLDILRRAHVVNLDLAQYRALPRDVSDLTDFRPDPNLPFPAIYVSVGDEYMAGVLMAAERFDYTDDGFTETGEGHDGFLVAPFWTFQHGEMACPVAIVDAEKHLHEDVFSYLFQDGKEWTEDDRRILLVTCADALKVVRFLECVNVDVAEERLSRQVRRNRQRKGIDTPIAMRVYVRPPTSRRPKTTSGEHVEYRHRFEVRGHYSHFGPDTRLFKAVKRDQPDKVIHHPVRGEVVRIWQPPHVKGPPEKPLVPKVRVYPAPKQDDES